MSQSLQLREWQTDAHDRYFNERKRDWLLHVTPGAGKTYWAIVVARSLIDYGVISRVVIVVPSENIRRQWAEHTTIKLSISLNDPSGCREPKDCDGCIVTYAQVASNPDIHRMSCTPQSNTLVIFDEIHHAGEEASWGEALEKAFEFARRRIALTGTPWRAPRRGKIPFVSYDNTGKVCPDFTYGYKSAVKDGVCRAIDFKPYDGSATYRRLGDSCGAKNTEVITLGEVDEDNSSVLTDILNADGPWMRVALQDGHHYLEDIRSEVSDAKGLVVVRNRFEARKVRKVLSEITGELPALVISDPESDEPNPQEEIERFSVDSRKWVVAVAMISEGVDIPSIYGVVYATNKKTPLCFRQIICRAVRQRVGEYINAFVVFPATQVLMELALEMYAEILHALQTEHTRCFPPSEKEFSDGDIENAGVMILQSISDAVRLGIISDGVNYDEIEVLQAEKQCKEMGIPKSLAPKIAEWLRKTGMVKQDDASVIGDAVSEQNIPYDKQRKILKALLHKSVSDYGAILKDKTKEDWGPIMQNINGAIKKDITKPGMP